MNNVVCHGIPDDRPLRGGDLISVDVTAYLDGYHGDTCATFVVPSTTSSTNNEQSSVEDASVREFCERSREITLAGIHACRIGQPISVIGKIIRRVKQFA